MSQPLEAIDSVKKEVTETTMEEATPTFKEHYGV